MFTEQEISSMLDDILLPTKNKVNRYPLTNLAVDGEDEVLVIEIALAGFDRDDIEISLVDNQIHISGSRPEHSYDVYFQKHISSSDFLRKIQLHDEYIGGEISAFMKNGLLTIVVDKAKKKTITVR